MSAIINFFAEIPSAVADLWATVTFHSVPVQVALAAVAVLVLVVAVVRSR